MALTLWAAVLVPLVAGTALVVGTRWPRAIGETTAFAIAVLASVGTLAAVGAVVWRRPQLDVPWVPALGIRLRLGVDGISIPLLVLTAAIGVLVVLHGRTERSRAGSAALYYGCLLLVTGGGIATFLARDAVLFFVAFELVLIPMWVLIGVFGDPSERRRAATMFVLYTALGSTVMLIGILALSYLAGTTDLTVLGRGVPAGTGTQTVIAALLLAGLAVKIPLWPLHSWLPAAHTAAPTGGSMLLAAVLLKMGTYGVVRLVVAPLPGGFHRLAPVVGILAVVGIIWAGLACLAESGAKRIIAFSSVAHMGVVMLAMATGTAFGLQVALFGNISHGVIAALLFAVVGGLKWRWHSDDIRVLRPGARDVSPRLGFGLIVGLAGSVGVPALAGFWAEALTVFAAWGPADGSSRTLFRVLACLAALGAVLGAAYALRVARACWAGSVPVTAQEERPWQDASGTEWLVVGLLILAVVVLGVWPTGLLHLTEPVVQGMSR